MFEELGFANEQELHTMVAHVDLSSAEKIAAFKRWQYEDGTKDGLLKLASNVRLTTSAQGPLVARPDAGRC